MDNRPHYFSEPAQRFQKEVDKEYVQFKRENPNLFQPGVRIPYRDYLRSRSLAWMQRMANVTDLLEAQRIINERKQSGLQDEEDSPLIEVDTEFLNSKLTQKPNEV